MGRSTGSSRDPRSTLPPARRIASRTPAPAILYSWRSSTANTSARTTSFDSRTTSDAPADNAEGRLPRVDGALEVVHRVERVDGDPGIGELVSVVRSAAVDHHDRVFHDGAAFAQVLRRQDDLAAR